MARTVRNAKIDTPSGRSKLTERREPYWTVIAKGCALGYRKGANGGTWITRYRTAEGKQSPFVRQGKVGARSDVFTAAQIERFWRLSVKAAKIYGYE